MIITDISVVCATNVISGELISLYDCKGFVKTCISF